MDKTSLEALQQQNEVLNFPQEVPLKECDTLKDVTSRYPCFLVHVGSNGGVMLVGVVLFSPTGSICCSPAVLLQP